MDPIEEVVNDLCKECFEDYVGLWTVPWHFQNFYHIDDEHLRREQSLKVIERLLAMPNFGVGQFLANEEVFEFWTYRPRTLYNELLANGTHWVTNQIWATSRGLRLQRNWNGAIEQFVAGESGVGRFTTCLVRR